MTDELVPAGWAKEQADLRLVFEENVQPMWVFGARGIVDVNQAALEHYAYSRDEFVALAPADFAAAGSDGPGGAGRHKTKDGSLIDVELSSFAITFGGAPAVLVCVLDVTYVKRTEAQTRYLDLLLATVTDAVVASDEKFVVTAWNAAAESTYGRRADEVLGQPDALVFRTDFVGVERAEAIRQLVQTGRFHGELTHRRRDGKRIHIESRAAALFDSGGQRLGYVSVNRDITERRNSEETIRALLSDVLTAQEEERRRIARELHDDTAQTLTSLLVGLAALAESRELDQARHAAAALRASVTTALDGVKRMARGLRPSILDDLGLEEALERLAAEVSRTVPFSVDLTFTGPRTPRLADAVEIALYRITQEALANVRKHAAPRAVSVLLHRSPHVVRLVVEDDGGGFDVGAGLAGTHLGLIGMRERAHLIGGSMTVESSPDHGTTLCVSVPIYAPAAPGTQS